MFKQFLRCISTLLVLVMLINMVPVQALTTPSAEESATEAAEDTSVVTEYGNIIAELSNDRDAYTKQFLLDNGNTMAVQYALPVHYQDSDGIWQQYDNRMAETVNAAAEAITADYTETEYRVIQSDKDIRLAKKTSEKKLVTIEKDGHQISWGFSGINKVDVTFVEEDATYEGNEAFLTLEGIIQEARYDNAFTNVDLQYYILPTGVKENIILKNADAQNEFEMEYKFHQLTATQTDSQHITLSDQDGDPVYTITAPAMCDANGVWSNALTLTIVEANENKLTVKLTADRQWLQAEERSFPVTVDPSFLTEQTWGSVDSTTLVSGHPDTSYGLDGDYYIGSLYVGYEPNSSFQKTRALVQLNTLPQLSPGDVIVDAQLCLLQQAANKKIQVNAHQATADWEMATATWNSMNSSYNTTVEDYDMTTYGTSAVFNSWNVTNLVRQWYDGTAENYGIMLVAPTETATSMSRVIYYASTYPSYVSVRPVFQITYRNHNGLEDYWDYTASSAGRAGTGYVNSYTGNLVWTRTDMGFSGNRGAVSIAHVYNTNDVQENLFGMGYGWRTNYNQRVYSWAKDSSYYVWEDGDGTDHYFKKESKGIYKDEDGLELTLTNTGSGSEKFVIENKYGGKTYFDANGRLSKISNNQETVSSTIISYTSDDSLQISTVTDGVDRVYAFTYNTEGLLSRLSYNGTGTTELTYTTYGYTNGLLTSITDKDGKTVSYTYDPDYKFLTAVQDIDGYKITYAYTHFAEGHPSRITGVQEFDGTAAGGKLTISYGRNETTFTDILGNKQILQFNNWGNTVSLQDGDGRAQFAEYAQDQDSSGKGNQLHLTSKLQNTVVNLLSDSSFEEGTLWRYTETASTEIADTAYLGSKSLKLSGPSTSYLRSPGFTAQAGQTYTFSGYVKADSGSIKLGIYNGSGFTLSQTVTPTDWTLVQISYTNTTDQAQTIYGVFVAYTEVVAYIDCVQAEQMPTASRYNLVNNGDFQNSGQWSPTNEETGDGTAAVAQPAPKLDSTAYVINGNALKEKNICQTVSVSGTAGDSFVLGGWASGDAVPTPQNLDRAFGLYAIFHYTDGTTSDRMSAKFNPDASGWQYTATALVAKKDYSSVDIYACYDYGANAVYFDGIQLFREEFGTSYTYDDEGNVISVIDLQKKNTEYEYDSNNNLTQIIEDDNVKMTYTYDDHHNVLTATTEQGYVYSFTYDAYGNNTSVSITEKTDSEVKKTITSSATYTSDYNHIATATDALGNVTEYGYDLQTGLLDWVQYPEDSEATRTEYTYDQMYRTATVSAGLDSTVDGVLSASYTYEDDLLKTIQTPSTTYTFTYGDFSLRTAVNIGDRNLATYSYETDTNRLQSLDYGNGDKVQYTYDAQGRLIQKSFEDGETVTYAYDNCGNLATVTDSETGIVTTYYYDLLNRQSGYREKGTGLNHIVTYAYDGNNNLASMTETVGGVTKTYTYTYDEDNRLISESIGEPVVSEPPENNINITYSYDGFGRLETRTVKQGDTVIQTTSPTYSAGNAENSTTGQISSYNGYTYTYDDNGNILTISDGTNTTSYEYDSANQLVAEDNPSMNYAYRWTYDEAGNILNRKKLQYITQRPLLLAGDINYQYNDTEWGDLLTSYGSKSITYDDVGNPETYDGWTYTWKHGRELVSMSDGTTTWTYTYDADGMRTKRTNGTNIYTYVYNGSKLTLMTKGNDTLQFTYDASGTPLAVIYNGVTYYYHTNLQGDILGIKDGSGNAVVTYAYDAWGVLLSCTGTMADSLGAVNPLRYRGYVYDTETGFYYLQSRYYNPEWGRFINADGLVSTGQGLLGNNMFAYCCNNPVNRTDPSGNFWMLIGVGLALGTCLLLTGCSEQSTLDVGAAPPYIPSNSIHQNCYGYVVGENDWKYVGGSPDAVTDFDVNAVADMVLTDAQNDGRSVRPIESYDSPIENDEYRIALRTSKDDYHFMMQHEDGTWSHKPGHCSTRLIDGANPSVVSWDTPIVDPFWLRIGIIKEVGYVPNYYDSRTLYFAISE